MAFSNIFSKFFTLPVVEADDEEEMVDPLDSLREKCQKHGDIADLYNKLQDCSDRVNSRSKTEETCMEEMFDYVAALDHCVAQSLFSKLR